MYLIFPFLKKDMDLGLLLYFAIVVGIIVLVFMFIKKIIWAIITAVLVFILALVGIAGLVYLDYQELSELENATIHLAYMQDDDFHTGLSFPVSKEDGVDVEELQTLNSLDYEKLLDEKNDAEFTLSIQSEVFDSIANETIELNDLLEEQGFSDYVGSQISIKVEDVQMILDSPNPKEEFITVLFKEMQLGSALEELARPLVRSAIDALEEEQGVDIHSLCFGLLLQELFENEENIVDVIIAYQNGDIEVHPGKLSFTMLKYVPISIINDAITGDGEEASSGE